MGNFKDLEIRLKAAVEKISKPDSMRKIGKRAVDMIRLRTQLGYGVAKRGGEKSPLKKLSSAYKETRKKDSQLDPQTSPGKSNLTRTGQMLNSLDVKTVSTGRALIGPGGSRNDGKDNADIGRYVSQAGRPFNNLSGTEEKRLNETIGQDLKTELQKNLTKR